MFLIAYFIVPAIKNIQKFKGDYHEKDNKSGFVYSFCHFISN